jgi:hypothetical protein
MAHRLMSLAVAALLASVAACSGSQPSAAPTTPIAPASTVAPTATRAPSAAVEEDPSSVAEPVDLVVMAASGGAGVDWRYAPLLAEALDREVRNHGHLWARPADVLSGAEDGAGVVAGAEAILMYFPPDGFEPPSFLTCLDALGAFYAHIDPDIEYEGPAWSPGQTWAPPEATTAADWQAWRDALDREYGAIWTLREGQPTIIRSYGGWNSWIPVWRQVGIESECTAGEEAYDQVMREAAEAAGAVHVSMLDVFTGPTHQQDPAEQGWIADDGMHLSEPGKDVLVQALASAGFDFNLPPD